MWVDPQRHRGVSVAETSGDDAGTVILPAHDRAYQKDD
jgi:hypothetical protein